MSKRFFIFVLMGISILISLFFYANPSWAQESTETDSMLVANQLYERGNFAEALQTYQELVDSGIQESALFYNLGNAYFKQKDSANVDIDLPHWNRVVTRHLCFPDGWVWFIRLLSWESTPRENLVNMIDFLLDQHQAGVSEEKLPGVAELADRFGCTYKVVMSIGVTVRNDADNAVSSDLVGKGAEERFNYWQKKYRIFDETMSHYELQEYEGRKFFQRKRLAYRLPQVAGRGWLAIGNASGFTNPIYSPGMKWACYMLFMPRK